MTTYGLIGHPLGHSFSQRWFTDLFHREGLRDHRYELFPMADLSSFKDLVGGTPGLAGLNVTLPHKQAVMPLLDSVDPLAAAVGAVNTVVIRNGRTVGHNTDVEGFRSTLLPLIGSARPRALVLGSGGASRAVAYVLKDLGIRFRVVSRSRDRGDLTWDLLDPIVVSVCTLIINTTPLGMHPDMDGLPDLPYDAMGAKHILVDLVYNPDETAFMRAGRARGAVAVNGLAMLQRQAEEAWRLWNTMPDEAV